MLDNFLIRDFLNEKVAKYNCPSFIEADPISIPHFCTSKEDIEIIGFLVATITWGNRKMILQNGNKLLQIMQNEPYQFILNFDEKKVNNEILFFNHRTFFGQDLLFFFTSLKNIYTVHNGLENCFKTEHSNNKVFHSIINFRNIFFELPHLPRTEKHISNPLQNSACKRINMFLRWMVRNDKQGVDFGIWKCLQPSDLLCPLDIHSGRVARELGILTRKQDDWKATVELTNSLKKLDPNDPIKYDFALFGIGVNNDIDFLE